MLAGMNNFESYIEQQYLSQIEVSKNGRQWNDSTVNAIKEVLALGVPALTISRKLNISAGTIQHWVSELEFQPDEKKELRKSIISEWYNATVEIPKKGAVTIDKYLDTYSTEGLWGDVHFVVNNLVVLKNANRIFPYIPDENDAYVFGANLGNGSLAETFYLQFTGTTKHKENIKTVMDVTKKDYLENDCALLIHSHLGRLYHCLGLPQGERQLVAPTIPNWIKTKKLQKQFIAGLFDTILEYSAKERHLLLRMNVYPEIKNEFETFIRKTASIITDLSVETTTNGVTFSQCKHQYIGKIYLKATKENTQKIRKNVPMKSNVF